MTTSSPIRIAFCCGSLEPGRDGVGDYTRRLAGEFKRRGHAAAAISLHDPQAARVMFGHQETEAGPIPVLRLPANMSWNQRAAEARPWLQEFRPGWISLQFVPFGFHPKGMPWGLGKWLANVNPGASWHIMFHELWLGLGVGCGIKDRLWGAVQRQIALDIARRLRPRVVHTQAEPYRLELQNCGLSAEILPLFSNISPIAGDGWVELLEPLIRGVAKAPQTRNALCLAGVLGSVHPQWDAIKAINATLPLAERSGKRIVLVFLGRNNLAPGKIQKLNADLDGRALVVSVGVRSPAEVSRILNTLDLGFATSPLQAIQKSGSVAAMLEHGLAVLVTRDDWRVRGAVPNIKRDPNVFTLEEFEKLENLPVREPVRSHDGGLERVASQMLDALAFVDAGTQRSRQKASRPELLAPRAS